MCMPRLYWKREGKHHDISQLEAAGNQTSRMFTTIIGRCFVLSHRMFEILLRAARLISLTATSSLRSSFWIVSLIMERISFRSLSSSPPVMPCISMIGSPRICFFLRSIAHARLAKPWLPSSLRSFNTSCEVSPTLRPSTYTMPLCTPSPRSMPFEESTSESPFSRM